MIEGRGNPSSCIMARLAVGGGQFRLVRWVVGLVVIIQMAADTGNRCRIVIPVMAKITIRDGSVGSGQLPIVIMDRE